MCIGFPGKENNGDKIMQVGKLDQPQANFKLQLIKTGKNKGNYLIEVYSNEKKVLDVQDSKFKAKANMVASVIDDASTTQVWKLNPKEETLISDPTGIWCITRENVIKPSEKLGHHSKSSKSETKTIHHKDGTISTHTTTKHTSTTITKHHTEPKKTSKLGLDFGSSFDFLGLGSGSKHAPAQ
jgi:hypothetical protein